MKTREGNRNVEWKFIGTSPIPIAQLRGLKLREGVGFQAQIGLLFTEQGTPPQPWLHKTEELTPENLHLIVILHQGVVYSAEAQGNQLTLLSLIRWASLFFFFF